MMQSYEMTPDVLNAEVNYRREQLRGTTFPGSARVRALRPRRRSHRRAA